MQLMCREYKFACLNWCASCYSALMMNLIWFADDKFSSLTVAATKNVQIDRIYASVGIVCGAYSSKTVHQHTKLARWLSFWRERHLTSCCLVVTQRIFFHQGTRINSPSKQG